MEFDKSRVYTVLNADELKVGSKVILGDNLSEVKEHVEQDYAADRLVEVKSEGYAARFYDGYALWNIAYLVSEPEEKHLKWTDLKVGDIITNGEVIAMVTQIDKLTDAIGESHVLIGDSWLSDAALAKENWKKVEDNCSNVPECPSIKTGCDKMYYED